MNDDRIRFLEQEVEFLRARVQELESQTDTPAYADEAERGRAEALRQCEERYHLASRATNDVIWDLDLSTNRIEWGGAAEGVLGYTQSSLDAWTADIHPEDRDRVSRSLQAAIDGGLEKWTAEYRFRGKAGEHLLFLDRGFIVRDGRGGALRAIGSMQDITERKRLEAERDRLTNELESTIQFFPAGLVLYDPEGEILRLNPAADSLLGYPPEFKRQSFAQRNAARWHKDGGKPVPLESLPVARALRGEIVQMETLGYTRPDGRFLWLSVSAAPIYTAEGVLQGVAAAYSDIGRLRQLQEEKQAYLHTITHDLRTPLTVIQGHAELLRPEVEKAGLGELPLISISSIHLACTQMTRMMEDLSELARLEGGKSVIYPEMIEINRFMADYLQRSRVAIDVSRVITDIPADLPPAWADPRALERCVGNLVSNALKYSEGASQVRISVAQHGEDLLFSVEDRGPGILPEDLPHVFERFFRARNTSKQGLGLGLFITRSLVEAQGGRIWADSEPGQGSRFHFSLPVAGIHAAAGEKPSRRTEVAPHPVMETFYRQDDEKLISIDVWRALVDSALVGVAVGDFQGKILSANDYFLHLLGFSRDDLKAGNLNWRDLTPPEHVPADEKALSELLPQGFSPPYEKEYFRKDGSRVTVLLATALLPAGQIAGFILDITKRSRMEKELRRSEATLNLAVAATELGIFDFYPLTGELLWSDIAKLHFGLPPEAHVDYGVFLRGLHPEDRERVDAIVAGVLKPEGGGRYSTEYRTIGIVDGRERWLSAHGQVFFNERQEPIRFIGATVDITERKRGEEALRQSELQHSRQLQFLETLLEHAQACIAVMEGRDLRFTLVNGAYQALRPEMPMLGRTYREVFPQAADAGAEALLLNVIQTGEPHTAYGYPAPIPDKPDAAWDHQVVRLPLIEGEPPSVLVITWDTTEHKRAENALRESEERYRTLFDSIDEGYCIIEMRIEPDQPLDYRFIEVNQAFERQSTLVNAVGKWMRELRPEHEESWFEIYRDVALTGRPVRFEHGGRALEDRWFTLYAFRVGPPEKRRVAVLFNDITERRRAEETLRASETQLSEAQRLAHIGSWYWDMNTDVTTGSDELLRIYGFDPATQTMPDFKEQRGRCYPVEDWERLNEAVQNAAETGIGYELDLRAIRSGEPIWITTRSEAVRDANGRIIGLRGTVQDITERKRAEEELLQAKTEAQRRARQAEEREQILNAMMEHIPMGITVADAPDVKIRAVSRYGRELTGKSREQIEGIPVDLHVERWQIFRSDGVTPATNEELPLTRATQMGELVREEEFVLGRGDGVKFPILCTAAPIRDAEGKITGGVIGWQDITERKNMEQRLRKAKEAAEEASRAKDIFLINMSHELRTPLTVNMGMLEMARLAGGCDEQTLQYLDDAKGSAESLLHLIEEILQLRGLQQGTVQFAREPFNLVECCREVLNRFIPPARNKGLQCSADLDPRLPTRVIGDCGKLEEVLFHLIGNAVKFTERGGIDISVRPDGENPDGRMKIHFEIRDTGIGIPADMLALLFQPFSQADPSLTRRYGGAGLGLAISKQMIEQLGGTIEVRSEEGAGSVFSFVLPFAAVAGEREKAPVAERRDSVPASTGESARILVVEDEPLVKKLLEAILTRRGYQVITADHGGKALEILEREPVDLILMDLKMPVMDGYEATRSIRQRKEWRDIPIIALTAHARPEDKEECLAAGMNDFLTKPVQFDALYATIETHLPSSVVAGA